MSYAFIAVMAALALAGLHAGAPLLVPVVEALMVWFVLNRLADALRRVHGLGPRLGQAASLALAAALLAVIGFGAIFSGVRGILGAGSQGLNLQTSLDPLILGVAHTLGTDASDVVDRMLDMLGVETLMQRIVLGFVALVNQLGVVAIYVLFLVVDQRWFPSKLQALFPDATSRCKAEALLSQISQRIGSYLWIMTIVSVLTASLSGVVMFAFGLNHLVFWMLLIFVLNFIPTLGSIIATILPSAFALAQFDNIWAAVLLSLAIAAVQFVIGNIVMPRMAGKTLNLSLVVICFSLFFWGALWGITGMFLAIPLTVILVIVAAQFDETRWFAVLLSQSGSIDVDTGPANTPDTGAR